MSTTLDGLIALTSTAVDLSRKGSGSRRQCAIKAALSACLHTALRQRAFEANATNPFLNLPDAILAIIFDDPPISTDVARICQRLWRFVHDPPVVYNELCLTFEPSWTTPQTTRSLVFLERVAKIAPHIPVRHLTIQLDDSMPRAWFAGMCHAVEAILDRVQDLSLEFPDDFEESVSDFMSALKGPAPLLRRLSIVQAVPRRSRTTRYSSQRVTAWTLEHMFVDGAPRLAHFEFTGIGVDISLFKAPHDRLSNLRTLIVRRIPSVYGAKDVDDLLAFLPNLEELSVWLSGGSEQLLAPCAFTTVHCKLRHLRVNQPQVTAFNVITLCAVLGSIQILAIDSDSWCGTRPCEDIHNVLPIISSIAVGSGLCEYVAHRSLDDSPMRILCGTGGFGWTYLEDILNAPTFSHLPTLSFHEFFCSHWSHGMRLPSLPNLCQLRIMLASCREYRDTRPGEEFFAVPPARTSILGSCDFEWDLPALRTVTVHISLFLSSRCDDKYRPHCTCCSTMSLALSDICSFSRAPLPWSGSNCTALRLTGFDIVDVDAAKYLCSLYTMFQEITISEQCEPECCDVDAGVWNGTQLSIFRDPLVIGS